MTNNNPALANLLKIENAEISAAYLATLVIDFAVARSEDNINDQDLHLELTDADFEYITDSLAEHYDGDDRPAFIFIDDFSREDEQKIRALANLIYSAEIAKELAHPTPQARPAR